MQSATWIRPDSGILPQFSYVLLLVVIMISKRGLNWQRAMVRDCRRRKEQAQKAQRNQDYSRRALRHRTQAFSGEVQTAQSRVVLTSLVSNLPQREAPCTRPAARLPDPVSVLLPCSTLRPDSWVLSVLPWLGLQLPHLLEFASHHQCCTASRSTLLLALCALDFVEKLLQPHLDVHTTHNETRYGSSPTPSTTSADPPIRPAAGLANKPPTTATNLTSHSSFASSRSIGVIAVCFVLCLAVAPPLSLYDVSTTFDVDDNAARPAQPRLARATSDPRRPQLYCYPALLGGVCQPRALHAPCLISFVVAS